MMLNQTTNNAFEAYSKYLAITRHFSSSYDYFKYNGKVKATRAAFDKRKDRFLFEKLSRCGDVETVIVANVLADNTYIREIVSQTGYQHFKNYQKTIQSLSHEYKSELSKLLKDRTIDQLLQFGDSQYPLLLQQYIGKHVSIQTVVILDKILDFIPAWDKQLAGDYIWPDIRDKLVKYRPFLSIDRDKFTQITREIAINRS